MIAGASKGAPRSQTKVPGSGLPARGNDCEGKESEENRVVQHRGEYVREAGPFSLTYNERRVEKRSSAFEIPSF